MILTLAALTPHRSCLHASTTEGFCVFSLVAVDYPTSSTTYTVGA